jgi:N-acetylmuramic acid 6-phosphate (MurNAc-6-P) etherase
VKLALLMARRGIGFSAARQLLEASDGLLRSALE